MYCTLKDMYFENSKKRQPLEMRKDRTEHNWGDFPEGTRENFDTTKVGIQGVQDG